jgi:hypothetical protein
VGPNRGQPFGAHDVGNELSFNLRRIAAKHPGVGAADEPISQIAAASRQHERRRVDQLVQLGLSRADALLAFSVRRHCQLGVGSNRGAAGSRTALCNA